jgi:hypothetical protein
VFNTIGQEQGEKIVNIHLAGRFCVQRTDRTALMPSRLICLCAASRDGNIVMAARFDLKSLN